MASKEAAFVTLNRHLSGHRPPANQHERGRVDVELEAAERVCVVADCAVLLHLIEALRRRRHGDGRVYRDVVVAREVALKTTFYLRSRDILANSANATG